MRGVSDADKEQPAELRLPMSSRSSSDGAVCPGNSSPYSASSASSPTTKAGLVRKSFTPPSRAVHMCAAVLSCCAGTVNAVCFLNLGVFASHVTGSVSRLGMSESWDDVELPLSLVLSFALGSCVCGTLVAQDMISLGSNSYGIVMLLNSLLLFVAVVVHEHASAKYIVTAACGLQNGMITMYSGAVVRTTHLTGCITDIGVLIGRILTKLVKGMFRAKGFTIVDKAYLAVDGRKLFLLLLIATHYCLGAWLGSRLSSAIGVKGLCVPASIMGCGGLMYLYAHSKNWFVDRAGQMRRSMSFRHEPEPEDENEEEASSPDDLGQTARYDQDHGLELANDAYDQILSSMNSEVVISVDAYTKRSEVDS